tara:strand:- start:55 stop:801 length:747 start_codon:yes stop_codon:yes gene_type:complete
MQTHRSLKGAGNISRNWRLKTKEIKRPWKILWKPVCSSTETVLSHWLKEIPLGVFHPRAVVAFRQLRAFGQKGRIWQSPGGGVWMSTAIPCIDNSISLRLLGLSMALALALTLEEKSVPVKIKWPNDLLFAERKLAGILPRVAQRGNNLRFIRFGIGLNVFNTTPPEGISLQEILGRKIISTCPFSADVLIACERAVGFMENPDFICKETFKRIWSSYYTDPISNENIEIKGINIDGSMLLSDGRIVS